MRLDEAVALTNEAMTIPRYITLAREAMEKTGRWASVDAIYKQVLKDLKYPENITKSKENVEMLMAAIRHVKHDAKRPR